MTDYSTLDESVQSAEPVYKFLFVVGETEYAYTNAPYIIGDSVRTWTPAAIGATSVKQTDDMSRNEVKITLPRTNALAQLFLGQSPELATSVTIYRGMKDLAEDNSDDQVYWKGRVVSAVYESHGVELVCENIFTSMSRPGLRARYQRSCRHSLYSTACGVSKNDFAYEVFIESLSGITAQLAASDSTGDSAGIPNMAGGMVETAEGYYRYIIAHVNNTLTLMQPFPAEVLESADSNGIFVTLYPGCNHSPSDCKSVFNNFENYGGFPYLPSKNPFGNNVTGSIA